VVGEGDDGSVTYELTSGDTVTYDVWGRPRQVVAGGRVTERVFDEGGNLVELRTPTGDYRIERTAAGRVASIDVDGVSVDVEWHGELITALRTSTGSTYRFAYDEAGRLTEASHGPQTWIYSYDSAGRLETVDAPAGMTRYRWDEASRPIATVVGSGGEIQYEWFDDRLAAIVDVDGTRTEVIWDDDHQVSLGLSGPDGDLTITRDNFGRVSAYRLPDGTDVEIGYGPDGVEQISIGNHTELWTYDKGQIASITTDGDTYQVDWASPGVPRRIKNDRGPVFDSTIDSAGRITEVLDSHGEPHATFTWDRFGIHRVTTSEAELEIDRDKNGHVTRVVAGDQEFAIEYDDGAVTRLSADNTSIEFGYSD
jgi:YD repeat-containing protein